MRSPARFQNQGWAIIPFSTFHAVAGWIGPVSQALPAQRLKSQTQATAFGIWPSWPASLRAGRLAAAFRIVHNLHHDGQDGQ